MKHDSRHCAIATGDHTMTDGKALVVLTQDDIDTAIHGLEQAAIGMDDDEFKEQYGDVYQKLHAIDRENESNYRVK